MTGVMGFVAQCEVCPQKAILTDQVASWVCPRCAEVADRAEAEECAPYGPPRFGGDRDRVSVQLADGSIFTGTAADATTIKRGTETIATVLKCANDLLEGMSPAERRVNGFGDIFVAAAEPLFCAVQSSAGRVCTKAEGHRGDPHADALGWWWWADGGRAYSPQAGMIAVVPPVADEPDLGSIRG